MKDDVTVVIPSIPPRIALLARALGSVFRQTKPPAAVAVAVDYEKKGAWDTRSRALDMAQTTWVAFLDDDDEFLPFHLERCLALAEEKDVDVVVPWFDVIGGTDPLGHREKQIGPELHSFGITCLVRREVIGDIRFKDREVTGTAEDWLFWNELNEAGARFWQTPETTWRWYHWGGNLSGKPTW